MINTIRANICFIGSDSFLNFNGPTTPSYSDYGIDKMFLDHSDKKYVLADSTKFTGKSIYQITDWKNITAMITNKVNRKVLATIDKGVNVIQSKD